MIILNGNWKEEIEEVWNKNGMDNLFSEDRNDFLAKIWEMSLEAFDSPREIQVIIDDNDRLFMSFGTYGYVSWNEGDKLEGMKLPLKCWIHTHPFGRAYFSGTDKKTIDIWRPRLRSAIVLGLHEHQTWFRNSGDVIHYQYKVTTKKKYVPFTEGFDLREEE